VRLPQTLIFIISNQTLPRTGVNLTLALNCEPPRSRHERAPSLSEKIGQHQINRNTILRWKVNPQDKVRTMKINLLSLAVVVFLLNTAAQAQPAFLKNIPPSSTNFTRAGDFVYYTAGDSLFRTDGTEAGTLFLKNGVRVEFSERLMEFHDLLIFVVIGPDQSRELWRSNGTASGTYFLKSTPYRTLNILGIGGDYFYFTASDAAYGSELFRSDGTAGGTLFLKDIYPGAGSSFPSALAAVGSQFFFAANDGIHGTELWKTNGQPSGTVLVKDINPGEDAGIGQGMAKAYNNRLYFSGVRPGTGAEAWISDGTATGTVLLKDLIPGEAYPGFIQYLVDKDGWLYFLSSPVSNGDEEAPAATVDFWRTNGVASGTMKIKSFTRCASCGYVGQYRIAHDKLYFFFNENTDRDILYTSDGTATGTIPLASLSSEGGRFVGEINGELLFFSPGYLTHTRLYRTDGTLSGTEVVRSFNSGSFNIGSDFAYIDIVAINDKVYFPDHDAPYDPAGGYSFDDFYQLMESDGSITKSIRSMGGGSYRGSNNLVNLNGLLIFTTQDVIGNTPKEKKLWAFDPMQPFQNRGSLTLVNADSEQDIQMLHDGDVVHLSAHMNYNIRFDPVSAPGSVVFKHQGVIVRRENAAPYSLGGDSNGNYLAWNGATPGSHKIEATPFSGPNGTGTAAPSLIITFSFSDEPVACSGGGSILREYWQGIPGNQVSAIPLSTPPTGSSQLIAFEGPQNACVNYGARIRGYICPPLSGNYIFWIASNDESELWLSDGDDPANKKKIAFTRYGTDPQQWDKFPSQRSAEIELTKGKRYYIEALHKQGVGTDHVAVGWQFPGGGLMRPIDGYYLSPFSGQLLSTVEITSPTEGEEFSAPAAIVIAGTVTGRPWSSVKIFSGDRQLAQVGSSPSFSFEWTKVPPGKYPLKVIATDDVGHVFESEVVNVIVTSPCSATGTITREQWSNSPGDRVSDIPVTTTPTSVTALTAFETQALGTKYGARIRGYLCPPATGDYVFWIASNDQSELWISTDDDPLNRQRVAYAASATDFRQWNKFSTQRSAPVHLLQGKRYYVEALHKQGVGSDHLSVGWQLPDGSLERPIGPGRLSPFGEKSDMLSHLIIPLAGSTAIDPMVLKLETKMIEGALRYTIEVSADPAFSAVKTVTSAADYQNIFIIKDLASATKYYARVKTDVSGFGPVTTFTTRDAIARLRLWGMTSQGGTDNLGTVFSYSIDDNQFVKHYDNPLYYDGYENIEVPLWGSLIPGPDGKFYGHREYVYGGDMFEVNSQGDLSLWSAGAYFEQAQKSLASNNLIYAANNDGMVPAVIDKYDPESRTILLDSRMEFFGQNSGPDAPLLERPDGYMYGVASSGGVNEGGFLFRFRLDGSDFKIIYYFSEVTSGMKPHAGLTEYNGYLYGTTTSGGRYGDHGTIFRIHPDGSAFTKLHDFDGVNGSVPRAELMVLNDVMYGTTEQGGASGDGTVFSMKPDGTGYSVLHSFNGADGAQPCRGVVAGRDGNLFGITTYGGANGMGVIYRVNSVTSAFARLFDLSQSSGGRPTGGLVIREDTYLPSLSVAREAGSADASLSVSIYPNPTTDNFGLLVTSADASAYKIAVMDQYGEIVAAYDVTVGEMMHIGEELNKGIYILKVSDGKTTMMRRLVKK
jgi:ELWxxDGT repeat protein/uncharacterized repeat protein (TIGR03803 family)